MAEKYRLRKDAPDAKAGAIFQRMPAPDDRWICHACGLAVSTTAIQDTEWFEPVKDRWTPRVGERYWYLNSWLLVELTANHEREEDNVRLAAGNCFLTESIGRLAAEKVLEVLLQFQQEFAK